MHPEPRRPKVGRVRSETPRVGTIGVLLLLAGPVLLSACTQGPEPDSRPEDLSNALSEIFSEFVSPGSPGAAVSVIHEGEVLLAEGFGLAEVQEGRPLSRTTPIRLGSVGKQFTSMAIMILADRGQLDFDDPVIRWVPELDRFPGIRVRHLLTHTSGLPDYYELPDEEFAAVADSDGDPLLTNEDAVTIYESWGEPQFQPGDEYEYSNPAYEVLALIVERISGLSFGEFLEENVFGPLQMEWAAIRDRPETVLPGRAIGYRPGESEGTWIEHDDHMANWLVGAGGVYASLDDLFLWDQAFIDAPLVSRPILDLAFSPTTLNDGSISEYGFGWNVGDVLGRHAAHHGGSWVGFRAAIIRFVNDATTVIVLSNASASAGDLAREVAEAFFGE
jgi:CubicO group peptidase (beta-lactamase class C family)